MKKIMVPFIFLLYFTPAQAQFDKMKEDSISPKMHKIFSVDTAVFVLLGKYSSKQISKEVWTAKTKLLMKKYDALNCDRLSNWEKELWSKGSGAVNYAII
jgi:hypothetical protein